MNVFEKIYQSDTWGFGSGHGSLPSVTQSYRDFLAQFMQANNISSVVDYGCGDWQFSKLINWGKTRYVGLDVAPQVIESNTKKYASSTIMFKHINPTDTKVPEGDLLIVKDVLQHLSDEQVKKFITHILPRFRYALVTNCVEPADQRNRPIASGEFRPLDIREAPFNVPAATVHVFTGPRVFSKTKRAFFPAWKKHVQLVQSYL